MVKFVLRAGCLTVIGAIAFAVIALMSGGEKFRSLGEKIGGVVRKATGELGDQADRIRDTGKRAKKEVDRVTRPDDDRRDR